MRLFVSPTSPYARMTRAVVIAKGLADQVEIVMVDPFADPNALIDANPTGTVPALTREDGGAPIGDSRLICAWLDHLPSAAPPLLPAGGPDRMAARVGEAAAHAITDRSVARVLEMRRPAAYQFRPRIDRLGAQIRRAIAKTQGLIQPAVAPLTLSQIALACALAHVSFRHPDIPWREDTPSLGAWLDAMHEHACLADTAPRDPAPRPADASAG